MSKKKEDSYIGLTIGPIFPTLARIRSTRALFAGSYLFSYLMKELIDGLLAAGVAAESILTPSVQSAGSHPEAGYYADRLILLGDDHTFQTLLSVRKEVLRAFSAAVANDIGQKQEAVEEYLRSYLILYAIKYDLLDATDPFGEINRTLNELEQQHSFPARGENFLVDFLNSNRPNFLLRHAFAKLKRFPSIIDISMADLRQYAPAHYDQCISQELNTVKSGNSTQSDAKEDAHFIDLLLSDLKLRKEIRNYHKYVAVVHADGDGIGQHIAQLDAAEFKAFSNQLFNFSQKAKVAIDDFGGRPIYIGGDDLLFLAPVAHTQTNEEGELEFQSIFTLINQLDDLFQQQFAATNKPPTISCGISLTYYKYPLNEARQLSYQLEKRAKKGSKNNIVLGVQKGSGAAFELNYHKAGVSYPLFVSLLQAYVGEARFLSSLIHRLGFHQPTIDHLCRLTDAAADRLGYFFDNHFNEDDHESEKDYFQKLAAFILALYQENQDQYFATLIGSLRFIHFIRSSDYDE